MMESTFTNIKIRGIATAVPKNKEVLADKYNDVFGEDMVAAFSKKTGVVERRLALPDQTASDLAFVAAEKLLNEKEIDRSEIGIAIFVTQTPDYFIPSTACVLHKRLSLPKDCISFDINLGCSGYVYGLEVVSSLMQTTKAKYGLLMVGDTSNKPGQNNTGIAPTDSSAVMLFGEGGSATLLERVDEAPAMTMAYRTDGSGFKAIIIPAGKARDCSASYERTMWGDGNMRSDYDLYMNGVDVFTFTITEVPQMINEFVETHGMNKDDFDCYAFHQANVFIFKQLIKRTKIPKDKLHVSMDRYGNSSVTSIPLTLCDKYGEDNNGQDRYIFSCGFGIGLSWGIVTFTVNEDDILPIIETDDHYTEGKVSHD